MIYSLDASLVVWDESEEFLSEERHQGGGGLWESQHPLQNSQHALPRDTDPLVQHMLVRRSNLDIKYRSAYKN